VDEFLAFR